MHRYGKAVLIVMATIGLAACAGEPFHSEEDDAKVVISRDAAKIVNEKGEATAAKAGTEESRKSDLVCERVNRTGSHMTQTYCYSRQEAERNRAKLQERLQDMQKGGARAAEQGGPPGP